MYSKRSFIKKSYFVVLFIIVLLSFSVGYSYLNSSLFINGTSVISANVWDISLDNLNISDGSVVAINSPIINNSTETTFQVKLEDSTDYYEFTVDVVNRGDVDAKLGSLIETTTLTEEQQKYFDYSLKYQSGQKIEENQMVKKNEFVRLKSKVEYKDNVNISSVPESIKILNLGFKLNYDLNDGNGVVVNDNGMIRAKVVNRELETIGSEICIGSECFYVVSNTLDSVVMLSKYNLLVANQYDEENGLVPLEKPTGIQDQNAVGWYECNYGFVPFLGIDVFSNVNYWSSSFSSYPAYVYNENSLLYKYLENYKSYLTAMGVTINDVRLISYEELKTLGCGESQCDLAPNWVYTTSYWTGSASSKNSIYRVGTNTASFSRNLFESHVYDSGVFGVRPVIVVPRSEIVDKSYEIVKPIVEFTILDVVYQAEEGMTWGEWINSKYNVDNFIVNNDKISRSDNLDRYLFNGDFDYSSPVKLYDVILPSSLYGGNSHYFASLL